MNREIKFRAWDKEKIKIRKGSEGIYKQNGYVLAKAEYHPHKNSRGYVPLHRLIMENELGRYLIPKKELIHHIDGNRENNQIINLKLTTPEEHYIEEHFEKRNPNGRFVANEPIFGEIKYRLFDRDKNITQIYTLKELMSKTFRRAKFEFRGRYTGLHDKNGVPIYESDLIYVNGQLMIVRKGYHVTDSVLELKGVELDLIYGHYAESPCGSWQLNLGLSLNKYNVSVIGNEYSNAELLKKDGN